MIGCVETYFGDNLVLLNEVVLQILGVGVFRSLPLLNGMDTLTKTGLNDGNCSSLCFCIGINGVQFCSPYDQCRCYRKPNGRGHPATGPDSVKNKLPMGVPCPRTVHHDTALAAAWTFQPGRVGSSVGRTAF